MLSEQSSHKLKSLLQDDQGLFWDWKYNYLNFDFFSHLGFHLSFIVPKTLDWYDFEVNVAIVTPFFNSASSGMNMRNKGFSQV